MMRKRAQSVLEYSVLICIIAAALAGMQVYLKRGMQGRMRNYADEVGGGFGYSPGATYVDNVITRTITENTDSYSEGSQVNEIKNSITDSYVTISQDNRRREETLPLEAEPQRE